MKHIVFLPAACRTLAHGPVIVPGPIGPVSPPGHSYQTLKAYPGHSDAQVLQLTPFETNYHGRVPTISAQYTAASKAINDPIVVDPETRPRSKPRTSQFSTLRIMSRMAGTFHPRSAILAERHDDSWRNL